MKPGSGNRSLLDDEASLWAAAVDDVRPIHGRKLPPVAKPRAAEIPPAPAPPRIPQPKPVVPAAPAVGRFHDHERRRLGRQGQTFDAKFDLHGFRHDDGHAALKAFLARAQAQGLRTVLVVTGKSERRDGLSTFRRQVPIWLGLAEFAAVVSAFDGAHPRHGGDGALYVRIRKKR